MSNFDDQVSGSIPEQVKKLIRPVYRILKRGSAQLFSSIVRGKRSKLAIKAFDEIKVAYRENSADEAVLAHSFQDDIFFPAVPEYTPGRGDVIIDVGAHIGTFSLLAASKVGDGMVYAIEASKESYNYLRVNSALNPSLNISPHHLALSDRPGTVTLYHASGNWGHSMVKKQSDSSETVQAQTLSGFLEEYSIDHCHLMKMNCEGAEFPVILGTPERVLNKIGVIIILYHCDFWKEHTETDLVTHLEASGFRCTIRNQTVKRGWIIAINDG